MGAMVSCREVEALAAGFEQGKTGEIGEREARLCAAGLRLLVDNERLMQVADLIEGAIGLPWDDPRVMRAAARIKLLYDAEAA